MLFRSTRCGCKCLFRNLYPPLAKGDIGGFEFIGNELNPEPLPLASGRGLKKKIKDERPSRPHKVRAQDDVS